MTIFTVDSSTETLRQISDMIQSLYPTAEQYCYYNGLEALAAARQKEVDIAFIDSKLTELSCLDFGQYLKDLYPAVNLIYLTCTRDFGFDAITMHASGCLLKPVKLEDIEREFSDLRHPDILKKQKRVYAQTFGNFEFFVDGKPVLFKYSRTKEIVALLVNNRGAQTTNGEIIATLWEDDGDPDKKSSYLSNLRQDLQNTFTRLNLHGILIKQRGSLAIAADRIECDLYDWLEKKKESRYRYFGDYMNQYSWAEYMHAELDEISYAMEDEE